PCAGEFEPEFELPDRDLIQLICAFRVCFPQVGLVLSTREPAPLRDLLLPLGVTMISAGSHTDPGGYTGEGKPDLHLTVRGREVKPQIMDEAAGATGQFDIADHRSPAEMVATLRARGFDPVWKDWDQAILAS
ncbi:MAG: 2-iminoacetate synthase ThiH, partial [Chthoniobacteraceae bacterium]